MFVERSRALGGANNHVVMKHVLPNVMPVIFANYDPHDRDRDLVRSRRCPSWAWAIRFNITWGTIIEQAFSKGAITIGACGG